MLERSIEFNNFRVVALSKPPVDEHAAPIVTQFSINTRDDLLFVFVKRRQDAADFLAASGRKPPEMRRWITKETTSLRVPSHAAGHVKYRSNNSIPPPVPQHIDQSEHYISANTGIISSAAATPSAKRFFFILSCHQSPCQVKQRSQQRSPEHHQINDVAKQTNDLSHTA